jgi:hypothetical protein
MLTELKTHVVYIALIALLCIFGHVWLSEHDARVAAENTIKGLKSQIVTTDAQVTQKTAQVTQIVKVTKTPAQVVAALPQLTDVDLNARVGPAPSTVVVDSTALLTVVADLKTTSIQLAGCQSDYAAEQQMVAALKKKPKFWKRVKKTVEFTGVVLGIGAVLGIHL